MSTVNQIIGGAFQNINGTLLANGYLIFELTEDCTVNTSTQICSYRTIRVPLDANGNVVVSPTTYSLWPNDLISPSGSFYLVTAYSAQGELVWGPNSQQVLSTPSPYNLDAWVPNDI